MHTEIVNLLVLLLVYTMAPTVVHDLVWFSYWRMVYVTAIPVCVLHWVPFVLKSGEQREVKYIAKFEFVFSSLLLTEILKGI